MNYFYRDGNIEFCVEKCIKATLLGGITLKETRKETFYIEPGNLLIFR